MTHRERSLGAFSKLIIDEEEGHNTASKSRRAMKPAKTEGGPIIIHLLLEGVAGGVGSAGLNYPGSIARNQGTWRRRRRIVQLIFAGAIAFGAFLMLSSHFESTENNASIVSTTTTTTSEPTEAMANARVPHISVSSSSTVVRQPKKMQQPLYLQAQTTETQTLQGGAATVVLPRPTVTASTQSMVVRNPRTEHQQQQQQHGLRTSDKSSSSSAETESSSAGEVITTAQDLSAAAATRNSDVESHIRRPALPQTRASHSVVYDPRTRHQRNSMSP